MRYKIINTDLLLNGKLIPEGSTIELLESATVGIEAYLQPLEKKAIPHLIRDAKTNKKTNIKKEKI